MKRILVACSAALMLCSCNRQPTPVPAPAAEKPEGLIVSHWTERTELSTEYPALVAGQSGRFAVHITRLDDFNH